MGGRRSMTQMTRHQTAIVWALAGLVVIAPHLLGGIFAWGSLSLAIAATLLAGTVAWAWSDDQRSRRSEPVAFALGAVLLLTVAHALPLPVWFARLLAPEAVRHTFAVHDLLGMVHPHAVPMTLDPGRTHERALYAVAVWATFCAALLVSTRRGSLLFAAVGVSGVLIALSDLGHRVFEATSVYGLYVPAYTAARGPILNANNLAGMLAMSTPVCLGLAARKRETRIYWGAGAVITGATCLLANSRGGTAALAAGVILFAAILWLGPSQSRRARKAERWTPRRLTIALVPLVALVMSFVVAHFAANTPLDTNYANLSKLDMLYAELRFLAEDGARSLIGVGRGALPAVFAAAGSPKGQVIHAENFALQYAIDFGIPFAVLCIGVVTVQVYRALLRWHSVAQLGALCGCVAIGLQNLFDFSLELTGIAVPAAACLAAGLAGNSSRAAADAGAAGVRSHASLAGSLAWVSAAAGAMVVTVFGGAALRNDVFVSRLDLQRRVGTASGDDFWPLYRESVLSHPADPALAMLGASRKVHEDKNDAWPWLERAAHLAPRWGGPHVLAAHWLLRHGQQDRAVAALRSAAEWDPNLTLPTLCDWLSRAAYAQVVFMVAPEQSGLSREIVLNRGANCLSATPDEAQKVDAVLLRELPDHLLASLRQLRRRISRHEYAAAIAEARAMQQHHPERAELYVLEAEALIASNDPARAARVLSEGVVRVQNRPMLLMALIGTNARAGDAKGMRDAVEQLRVSSAGNRQEIARALAALSSGESTLGNHAQALRAAREAYDIASDASYLALAAGAAERLGHTDIALDTWTQACREAPSHPTFCSSRDALTKRLASQTSAITP
jgi:hypothetical protein